MTPAGSTRAVVVGAGLSGALLARTLHDAGMDVQVLEKARGPGGRTSTRRDAESPRTWDHGAPSFVLNDAGLRAAAKEWTHAGVAALRDTPEGLLVTGTPGMNAIARHLLHGVPCRWGATVARLDPTPHGGFTLRDPEGATLAEADLVLLTAPAPQAVALLATAGPSGAPLAEALRGIDADPALVALVTLSGSWGGLPADLPDDGPLEGASPGSAGAWTLRASAAWSRAHLEDDPKASAAGLVDAARAHGMPEPLHVAGHRWRYARVRTPLAAPFVSGIAVRAGRVCGLAACGDAFSGIGGDAAGADGAERALGSARALASAVTGALTGA